MSQLNFILQHNYVYTHHGFYVYAVFILLKAAAFNSNFFLI